MRASISTKLLAITVGVVSLAVALAGGALLRQHHRELERGFEDGTVVLARAVAEHCVGPVAFEDRKGAEEILAKLERSTVVGRAILYDRHNRVMASYDRLANAAPVLALDTTPVVQGEGYLHVFEPVLHGDDRLGTLYLTASSAGLRGRARSATNMVVMVGLAGIAVAALLAWALQRTVTRPILRLAETMRGITGEAMHLARVEHRRTDEIGSLHAGFNRMLDQLAARQVERDRSDARLRALIAALPDPVFVLDENGCIVEVLAGRPGPLPLPASLTGKRLTEVITPEIPRPIDEGIAQAISSLAPQRLAYELDTPAGKRCFDAVIVPISGEPTPHGPGRSVLFVPRDITERQTLELDLRQAQKMDALGRLAGGVAHDFNNLLTAIMGYASLLMGLQETEGQSTAEVEEILKAGKRAALLTQQLLAFSRRHMVQVKPVALNELVRDMQRMLERIIGEDVQLVAELSPSLSPVQGDPGQLQQVILNLAVNAREAMPNGGTLTLRTRAISLTSRRAGEPELKPGRYVLLEVTDTGVGMDESTRARIFEPFFTTKGRTGGTGLGLAMVYGIVRQSGGDVSVSSERHRGTTFRIYLPESVVTADAVPLSPPVSESVPRGSETVLVVEDEEPLKELTCRMLRDQGYQVLSTTEARQALDICGRHPGPIHLLVTDMVMPRMGGAELAEAARTLRADLRVLYMSGYTDSATLNGDNETVPFLQKPFTALELGRRVREALGAGAMVEKGARLANLENAH